MNLAPSFAHFVTHRRRALYLVVFGAMLAALAVILFKIRFASDVLDLLPQPFESVQAFKTFDRAFSQARELTFALRDEKHVTDFDAFTDHFSEALRAEPWIERVLDRSPMESPSGLEDVRLLALPMLFNLPSSDFKAALETLAPEAMTTRLKKLRAELEAGSPKAEFQLDFDPLGLVAPALKPLAGSFSMEQTRPLSSADGTLRIVLAKTTQTDLGAHACQATMRQVEEFKKRVLATWTGPAPEILVTGRTPYVGELSLTMRGDVISTVLGSVLLVAAVFYLGFRRLRPLFAIMNVLALCCLGAVAMGTVFFAELNMITVGLCSILIGLGVDFGMMLYAVYEQERGAGAGHEAAIRSALESQGKGVLFGALTTAVGFLCFLRSESTGFIQLGVLIAFGILFAALFMTTIFFAFVGERFRPRAHDWLWSGGQRFVAFVYRSPRAFFLTTTALLGILSAAGFGPVGRLVFDANPRSLEPKDSHAGTALRIITEKMPVAAEPLILLRRSHGAEDFHESWARLQKSFDELIARGRIKSATSPAAFAISPARVEENSASLPSVDFAAARANLTRTLAETGLSTTSFHPAFALLDALEAVHQGKQSALDWRKTLPAASSWWFVLDRFFSRDPDLGAAYVTPIHTLSSFAEKEQLRLDLQSAGVPVQISGWSYTLQDLVPWARGKLTELTTIMVLFNLLLLIFLYRSAFPLFILMASLALSVGALVASLKLCGIPLNLFNVLAFPLVLGVGVDYGIYIVIAIRQAGDQRRNLATVVKPVLLSGLTTVCGFGSLGFAANPALHGLGIVCALGVAWCLFSTLCFVLPAYAWRGAR